MGTLISVTSVVVFVSLFEGCLALVGYGHSARFYELERLEDGSRIYRENRWFAFPYFSEEVIRRPQSFRLNYRKPSNEYRIILMGSSAAMGDPEPSFSIARILDLMLEDAYAEKAFEVVNAAMTAINSHVVRRIARDVRHLDPDLFIVYEGNNEVIGPYGPTGVLTPFLGSELGVSWIIRLRESRMGQFLNAIIRLSGKNKEDLHQWGGMQMFLHQQISKNDPRLVQVGSLFRSNLRRIIHFGKQRNIKTFLCTVLTNQKDFAPFQSRHRGNLSSSDLQQWNEFVESGDHSLLSGEIDLAQKNYLDAWKIDDQYADLAFKLGRIYLQEDEVDQASYYLKEALDLDTLRFRTDSLLNSEIRELAKVEASTCVLVDLESMIAQVSPHGLIGDEWLYEHVHMNFYTNYQIARILFESVSKQMLLEGFISNKSPQDLSYDAASKCLAYTLYEQGMIAHEMLNRLQNPPFTAQMDHASRIAAWMERVAKIDQILLDPSSRERICKAYLTALEMNPDDWVIKRNFGMALLSFGDASKAIFHLESAHDSIPNDVDLLFSLGLAYLKMEKREEAQRFFKQLLLLEPNFPDIKEWLNKTIIEN